MKNGQNTDLNNQNVEFGGPLKTQKMAKNEFTYGNNELLCSRVSRYNFKHKFRKNKPALQWFVEQYPLKTSRHTRLKRLGLKQQAILRGLSTSDRFSRKELSKYRLKPPKYIVF